MFALQRPFTLRHYDLIHYMDSRPPVDFPLGTTRTVITQHGFAALMFEDYVSRTDRLVNRALLRLAPSADLTLTASESERDELLKRAPIDPGRVIVIHHGVDHDRFFPPADPDAAREEVRRRLGVEGRYVLYVSNHQRKKNPERLVQAFAQVASEHPDISLVLVGRSGSSFGRVQDLIEQFGLRPRTHVLGHIPDDALPALFASATVFALPSLHEGFGIPVLEAMACGTPVVASNVYALPEVCGDAAELVDPYSVDSIAEALLLIIGDPERARTLRELGLARAETFTWRRAAEQHLDAYEQLVGSR
jgi:glycosyltransferase involved in cell wall biosynthesis